MQRFRLANLRHQGTALFQHLGGDPARCTISSLGGGQHAGHRVEQAQRATVRRAPEGDASVVADARPTCHQRIGGETWILARIGYLEQLVLAYGMGAEGNFASRLADALKADVGLEPLAVFGHHGDQAHRQAGRGAGGGDVASNTGSGGVSNRCSRSISSSRSASSMALSGLGGEGGCGGCLGSR